MELIGSGTYGCVYFPGFNCKGKSTKKGNHVSKITTDKIGIESEVNAGKRIKEKLANYKDFFLIVDKKCNIRKSNLNTYVKNTCKLIDKNTMYSILYSNHIYGYDLIDYYNTDLSIPNNIRNYYSNFFIYTENLLIAMLHLENINLVHFDISLKNIRINENTNKALIIDFGLSMLIDDIITKRSYTGEIIDFNKTLFKKYFSINPIESFKYCFEIQLLCFISLNYRDYNSILRQIDFDYLVKEYYKKNSFFHIFSEEFKKNYVKNIYTIYSKFIGQSVSSLACFCLSTWKSWDSFNLSYHLISILYNLDEFYPITIKLIHLFMKQLHCDPSKRLSPVKVIEQYYNIINNQNSKQCLEFKSFIQNTNTKTIKSTFDKSVTLLYS
tara:strand:+ start:696 stop:1844 length:1149 start_codon:yes stop_codon:yes gene_type:complete